MNVKIIADSTCDLPHEIINKYDIDIIPLYVILDDVSYKDKAEITPKQLIEWSNENNKTPKTSAPSVEDFLEVFKLYARQKRDIVFVSISSELSATCQNANIAAEMTDGIKIKVIDGRNVSTGTGCVVYMAAQLAKNGLGAEEIALNLQYTIPKVMTGFVLDRLDFLRRGGRCSAVQAIAASSLKLRPEIISVEGKLVSGDKFRGSLPKVVLKYAEKRLENLDDINPDFAFVVKTEDEENLNDSIYEYVRSLNYFKNVYRADAGCVITAHSGPGTHGIFYLNK